MKSRFLGFASAALLACSFVVSMSANAADAAPVGYAINVKITKVGDAKPAVMTDWNELTFDGFDAPWQLGKETGYVAAWKDSKPVAGSVWSGVAGHVVPTTLPGGKVRVAYKVVVDELLALPTSGSGGYVIQTPTVKKVTFNGVATVSVGVPLTVEEDDRVMVLTITKQ